MSLRHLTTPTKIAEAIERQGVLGVAIDAPSRRVLDQERGVLIDALGKQGVDDPAGFIDRVKREVAERGDADGLYENTDEARAHEFIRRELNGGRER